MMENFHHIFATLSRLKISCLEAEKKEAKQKYTDHLQSYVIYSLGQPLEKLNVGVFSFSIFFLVCTCVNNTVDTNFEFVYVLMWTDEEGGTQMLQLPASKTLLDVLHALLLLILVSMMWD